MKPRVRWGEDYESFYGKIDYTDKRVLDIGADYGSTADYFLQKGARDVVAVEPNKSLFKRLSNFATKYGSVIVLRERIEKVEQCLRLYNTYLPNIVQIDCEGCELHFLALGKEFTIPEGYVVETHSEFITNQWLMRLKYEGYEIIDVNNWTGKVSIITAKR